MDHAGASRPQGSYSINLTPNGRTVYLAANSGQPDGYPLGLDGDHGVQSFLAILT